MLLTVLAGMALAPSQFVNRCIDDRGKDRCMPAKQAETRALYRVPPIESYASATVRRIFFVDGYGSDTIAIEFVRDAEKDAAVRVHFPKVKGEEAVAPIEQPLGADEWQEVIGLSEHFHKKFAADAPRRGNERKRDEPIALCLHSWVYWAEAIDPDRHPRSTVDDACNNEPVESFAWFAAKIAREAIPFCAALDKRFSRNDATLLRTCSRLSGDRLAAAEVWNRAEGLRSIDTPRAMDDLPAYDLNIDFQGQTFRRDEAKAFWRSLMGREDPPHFYYHRVTGLSADQVLVAADLVQDLPNNKYQMADVEMRWRKAGGFWELKSITVGPYRPLVLPSE